MRLESKDIDEIVGKDKDKGEAIYSVKGFALEELLERQKMPLFLLGAAVFLVGIGFAAIKGNRGDQGNQGEQGIVFETERRDGLIGIRDSYEGGTGPIFVDVAGAVERPGVYELAAGARVKDGLIAAGGLAARADREFVAKNLNLAAPLMDGAKVYIPSVGEINQGRIGEIGEMRGIGEIGGLININTASAGELEKLQGIGPVRAGEIIANRPYGSVEELKSKGVLGAKTYEKVKNSVTVF